MNFFIIKLFHITGTSTVIYGIIIVGTLYSRALCIYSFKCSFHCKSSNLYENVQTIGWSLGISYRDIIGPSLTKYRSYSIAHGRTFLYKIKINMYCLCNFLTVVDALFLILVFALLVRQCCLAFVVASQAKGVQSNRYYLVVQTSFRQMDFYYVIVPKVISKMLYNDRNYLTEK